MKNDELSIGQRRRVQVAREFMHDMDLLFLDEPTVGLDPAARRTLLDYVKNYVRGGLTVFFTTHIMEEA
jgi:ABC-2 type transport system ATP-binding protein